MRQYLIIALVASMAGVFLVAGCSTTNNDAVQRSLYVDEHPELPELMAEAIVNGRIMVGMSEEMVQVAWGQPARSEAVTSEEDEATIQWIYGNYFVGGTITNLFFTSEGTLIRYEVKSDPVHANGSVEGAGMSAQGNSMGSEVGSSKGGVGP